MDDDTKNQNDSADDINLEAEDDVVGEESLQEKIKQLRAKLKEAEAEKQKYLDNWQRAQAEFINIRKRDEEDKKRFALFASQDVIEKLVPVLESFDGARSQTELWNQVSKEWRTGMESIHNQLIQIVMQAGVTEIDPLGAVFDPKFHEAVTHEPATDTYPDGTVSKVLQKGYMMHDKILKPARVIVAQ